MKEIKVNQSDTTELGKGETHLHVQITKYIPKAVVSKTILRKITGNITAMSVPTGETIAEKNIAFDAFIQIIEGVAEVVINEKKYQLKLGNAIIIPAHATRSIIANEQFKMILTIIKSGYEDLPL